MIAHDVAQRLARLVLRREESPAETTGGKVTRIDADGTTWVQLYGNDDDTPCASTTVAAALGDVVTVTIDGGTARIDGNVSKPSTDDEKASAAQALASQAVAGVAEVAEVAKETAQATADAAGVAAEAQSVASATNQHFFSDSGGVHVTEAEGDATTEHNILINSLGILLRKATNYLVSITSSAIAFYDGLGTAASNIVASFGASGAQIGKASAGNYVTIDSDSFDLYHSSTEMVHFGYGEGNASSGTANAPYYTIGTRASGSAVGNYSIAEGVETTASAYASHAEGGFTTASGIASHAEGVSTTASGGDSHAEGYNTTASGGDSHAEGVSTTASGSDSHAEGFHTTASGAYSHAQNRYTIAASEAQTALGRYNVTDANDTYAVIVGNGTDDLTHSNALTVDWSGNVVAAGAIKGATTGETVTVSDASGSVTAYYSGNSYTIRGYNIKVSSALASGSSVTIGTAAHGPSLVVYMPCAAANATYCGRVYVGVWPSGAITLYNYSGSSLPTTVALYFTLTYVL